MSENDVKTLLRSMKKLNARREVLKCLEKTDNEYNYICKIIYIMDNSLKILSEDEREIIRMHLIEGDTWEQVIVQYEDGHGKQNGYSRRTYERIQQKSVKKILEVIENSEIDGLLQHISVLG